MPTTKTKCNKCVHKDTKATQYPCSQCEEIHPSLRKFENQFLNAIKIK